MASSSSNQIELRPLIANDNKDYDETTSPKKRPSWASHNFISRNLCSFMVPVIRLSWKGPIKLDHLDDIASQESSQILGARLSKYYQEQLSRPSGQRPSFVRALFRANWLSFVVMSLLETFMTLLEGCRSVTIGLLVRDSAEYYLTAPLGGRPEPAANSTTTSLRNLATPEHQEAYERLLFDAGILMLCCLVYISSENLMLLWGEKMSIRWRVASSQMVYDKSLRLSQATASQCSQGGQILNLLANDIQRLDGMLVGVVDSYSIIFHVLQYAALLCFVFVGFYATLACFATMLAAVLLLFYICVQIAKCRQQVAPLTDKRIGLVNEIMSSIRTIKVFAWEHFFEDKVNEARRRELAAIGKSKVYRTLMGVINLVTGQVVVFATLITYTLTGGHLDTPTIFVVMTIARDAVNFLTNHFSDGLSVYSECLISCKRINDFLQLPEVEQAKSSNQGIQSQLVLSPNKKTSSGCITMDSATIAWPGYGPIIENLTFDIKTSGEFIMIIGRVGSGKSSILMTLIGELAISNGSLDMAGTISYAPQEAWIFAGTIKENILFGKQLDAPRYEQVIRACSLIRDFELLGSRDETVVGESGVGLSGGQRARVNLARALYHRADIYLLDDPLSALDAPVARHVFFEALRGLLKGKTVLLATHQLQFLSYADRVLDLNGSKPQFKLPEIGDNVKPAAAIDASKEPPQKPTRKTVQPLYGGTIRQSEHEKSLQSPEAPSFKSYIYYLGNCGNSFGVGLFLIVLVISEGLLQFIDYFLSSWSSFHTQSGQQKTTNLTYLTILCLSMLACLVRIGLWYYGSQRASRVINKSLLHNVLGAQMQFFDSHRIGSIMNRFSRDMGNIDEILPRHFADTLVVYLVSIVGGLTLTMVLEPANILVSALLIVSPFVVIVPNLNTMVKLMNLDNESKSRLFSHVSSSISGLATIRSFKAQDQMVANFVKLQNNNTIASFGYIHARTLLTAMACLILIALATIELFTTVMLRIEATSAVAIGLTASRLNYVVSTTQLAFCLFTMLAGYMASVERVAQYCTLLAISKQKKPKLWNPKSWRRSVETPIAAIGTVGQIDIKHLTLRYPTELKPTLTDVSISIRAREKIGVVGRTGAGKSSLVGALLRLYPYDGTIEVDGLDTKLCDERQLRNSISIIPQEPVLFSGTLRSNLDPFSEHSDSDIWFVLEAVQLSNLFDGLQFEVHEKGANLSLGQSQLICLARAILRRNKVLVLDEATSSVDPGTEALVQHIVGGYFSDCTVITIAHRLKTIAGSDRVLVLNEGRVAEFDDPYILIEDSSSEFSQMLASHQSEQAKEVRRCIIETREKRTKL